MALIFPKSVFVASPLLHSSASLSFTKTDENPAQEYKFVLLDQLITLCFLRCLMNMTQALVRAELHRIYQVTMTENHSSVQGRVGLV